MTMTQLSQPTTTQVRRSLLFSRWYIRWPLKWAIFLIVTFFVLFPSPTQFARHVSHFRNLNAMIDPDYPQLASWADELRQRIERGQLYPAMQPQSAGVTPSENKMPATRPVQPLSPASVQRQVEAYVLEHVQYDWDWNVWGSADYMPTVAEMFAQAAASPDGVMREDCDGRAVMAASLMRHMGYDASIVTDLRHVWVTTPEGEWMGPGREKTIVSTAHGNRISPATAVNNVFVGLSYGVAVFPLVRELVILVTVYLLMLNRQSSPQRKWIAAILLLQGLLFMRCGVFAPTHLAGRPSSWPAWVGLIHVLGGFCLLWFGSRPRARTDVSA